MDKQTFNENLGNFRLADALIQRRSIRIFKQSPIPKKLVDTAIYAALLAPSPHGTFPWRFCIINKKKSKTKLGKSMGEKFLEDMKFEGISKKTRENRYQKSLLLIQNSPLIILVSLDYSKMDFYEERSKQHNENMMAEHSLGAALQNLMIALAAQGIGSVWRCAPLFCPEIARDALNLPKKWIPRAMILAGFPKIKPTEKKFIKPRVLIR
tara:strand:+ start:12541 stop:13170 length:630 start_codon:yes stop_codon:yes gene_type:complete